MIFAAEADHLHIPISFKPYLETIRWACERDENGQTTKTLREIKERVDPLKEGFFELLRSTNTFSYFEKFKRSIDYYGAYYWLHYNFLTRQFKSLEQIEREGSAEVNAVHHIIASFQSIQGCYDFMRYGVKEPSNFHDHLIHKIFFTNPDRINNVKLMNNYLLPQAKKALFPFYVFDMFDILINISDLVFDHKEKKILYENENGELLVEHVTDLTDKLDHPFLEAFDIILKDGYQVPPQIRNVIMDHFNDIYDNFVTFGAFFEFESGDGVESFTEPLAIRKIELDEKISAEKNINDIFDDQKSLLESDIGLTHFNFPIFGLIPDESVAVVREKIHAYLPLDLFKSVVDFEENQGMHAALKRKYGSILFNYNPIFATQLMKLGKLIQEFQDINSGINMDHKMQRIMIDIE
ncbi:MAG: hypothetical protein NEHIOOID_00423 [Holosporales bacterium]